MNEMEKLREKQRRRRRKRTLRLLAISPLIALVFVAGLSFLTRIDTVLVRNNSLYATSAIRSDFGFSVGDSIFSVDRDKLASQITVSCPYVKNAEVEYGFPNRIEISLTPATVCFAVRFRQVTLDSDTNGGGDTSSEEHVLLLDEDFKVLEEVSQIPENVLFVDGMDIFSYKVGYVLDGEDNIQTGIVRDLIDNLKRCELYDHVSDIDLTKKYNITMTIHDVISVELGNSESFDAKMNMLVKILGENDITVPALIRVRNYSEGRYSRLPDTDSSSASSVSSSTGSDTSSSDTRDYGTPEDVEKSENS
ncbi:MAG: FtsQ-type POTRA domain-containing protein [Clostridia bacterium]|nr:FtsQ-type POTRA domain-containing protein [Clostridia bacterium]